MLRLEIRTPLLAKRPKPVLPVVEPRDLDPNLLPEDSLEESMIPIQFSKRQSRLSEASPKKSQYVPIEMTINSDFSFESAGQSSDTIFKKKLNHNPKMKDKFKKPKNGRRISIKKPYDTAKALGAKPLRANGFSSYFDGYEELNLNKKVSFSNKKSAVIRNYKENTEPCPLKSPVHKSSSARPNEKGILKKSSFNEHHIQTYRSLHYPPKKPNLSESSQSPFSKESRLLSSQSNGPVPTKYSLSAKLKIRQLYSKLNQNLAEKMKNQEKEAKTKKKGLE